MNIRRAITTAGIINPMINTTRNAFELFVFVDLAIGLVFALSIASITSWLADRVYDPKMLLFV